jgi:hypothetical protein
LRKIRDKENKARLDAKKASEGIPVPVRGRRAPLTKRRKVYNAEWHRKHLAAMRKAPLVKLTPDEMKVTLLEPTEFFLAPASLASATQEQLVDPKFSQAFKDAVIFLETLPGESFYYICSSVPEGLTVPEAGLHSTDLPCARWSRKPDACKKRMKVGYKFVSVIPYCCACLNALISMCRPQI